MCNMARIPEGTLAYIYTGHISTAWDTDTPTQFSFPPQQHTGYVSCPPKNETDEFRLIIHEPGAPTSEGGIQKCLGHKVAVKAVTSYFWWSTCPQHLENPELSPCKHKECLINVANEQLSVLECVFFLCIIVTHL